MDAPPAGISEADRLATPTAVRAILLAQQQEIQALRQENGELREQLTIFATHLASLRERIGRSSRNSSKPPSSEDPGHRCAEAHRATSRQSGARPVAAGAAASRVSLDRGQSCCRCGSLLEGEDPEPLRHQLLEIPAIALTVLEHRRHRLVCPCCSRRTCATFAA